MILQSAPARNLLRDILIFRLLLWQEIIQLHMKPTFCMLPDDYVFGCHAMLPLKSILIFKSAAR